MPRIAFRCPSCGSEEDVVRDAYASWNVDTQEWELSGVQDNFACNECGDSDISPDEFDPDEEVELEDDDE